MFHRCDYAENEQRGVTGSCLYTNFQKKKCYRYDNELYPVRIDANFLFQGKRNHNDTMTTRFFYFLFLFFFKFSDSNSQSIDFVLNVQDTDEINHGSFMHEFNDLI